MIGLTVRAVQKVQKERVFMGSGYRYKGFNPNRNSNDIVDF